MRARISHFDEENLRIVMTVCGGNLSDHLSAAVMKYKDDKLLEVACRNSSNQKIRTNLEQTRLF